jgi:hypothetical protein
MGGCPAFKTKRGSESFPHGTIPDGEGNKGEGKEKRKWKRKGERRENRKA